jgi:hypothetical protein
LPADTVESIATGNEIAFDLLFFAIFAIANAWSSAFEFVKAYILRLVNAETTGTNPLLHQVTGNLGLAVNHYGFAGERTEINVAPNAANTNLNAIVDEPFAVHTRTRAGLVNKVYGALLDDPSSNTTQNVVPRLALENNIVNFVLVQKLTE